MSIIVENIDLTLFGCPMHYIKARESLRKIELDQGILLIVNNGDAVTEVLNSLRQDGQDCEIESEEALTTTIKVIKKYVRN
jgi:TusA-related sulfurtransferase